MTIYRGPGGTGEARTDSDVTEVRIIADEAEGYKDQAATSASAAASSASAAATAETNAETAEANAETAEANAEAAQAAAEAAQAAAEAAQTAAEAAQTAAELAETNAETAEANAETAEANAETAQAAAEAALASAQAVYDNFDDRYLGAKTSNPTVDNDGGALLTGALYFNTTVPEMRVYTGSSWTDFSAGAAVSSFNTRTGAVTLTDTDVNTALGYTAANNSSVLLKANNLSDLTSASTARTNLGLGTAATTASTAYATAAQGTNADTAYGWGNHASAGYAADSAVVKLTGDQTVGGTKTFSSTITGSVSGNAATATTATNLSGGTVSATSISDSGNLTFTGTGNRITGDFTNGTVANRVMFQTSTANTGTFISAIANGTVTDNTGSGFVAWSNSDPTASQAVSLFSFKNLEARLTSGSNTGTYAPLTFYTGGSERMRVDTSGNVGIGTSSPSAKLQVNGSSAISNFVGNDSNNYIQVSDNNGTSYTSFGAIGGGNAYMYSGAGKYTAFYAGGSERARIDSSGNLLVGTTATTSNARLAVKTSSTSNLDYGVYVANSGGGFLLGIDNNGGFATGSAAGSPYNATTVSAANVFVASSGLLQRSTSSLKYKKDVQDAAHGLAEVMTLRPVTYKGKTDGETVFGGLIAEEVHEAGLTEFVQYAEDGSPDALAYGQMVSLAFKAIQEQQAIIAALTARVEALEYN